MVLILRNEQMASLGATAGAGFVDAMCRHLRQHFSAALEELPSDELRVRVVSALHDASVLGLISRRDSCRYLNLCATYGWQFDRVAGQEWMQRCLTDESVSSPGARLDRLVDQCLHRLEVEAHDEALRKKYAPTPEPPDELIIESKEAPEAIDKAGAPEDRGGASDLDDDRILEGKVGQKP